MWGHKHACLGILTFVFVMALVPCAVADTNGTYNYTVDSGHATVDQYIGPAGAVNIPSTLGGAPVTAIGQSAFTGNPTVTSVTIPEGVTSIGNWAFRYCTGLTEVTLPDSLDIISLQAFYQCTSLVSASIPSNVTSLGVAAFAGCSSLPSVTIPASVTGIGSGAFFDCSSMSVARFLGNAPTMGLQVFDNTTPGFTVYFIQAKSGFAPPPGPWLGYSTANFSDPETQIVSTPASSPWSLAVTALAGLGFVTAASLSSLDSQSSRRA